MKVNKAKLKELFPEYLDELSDSYDELIRELEDKDFDYVAIKSVGDEIYLSAKRDEDSFTLMISNEETMDIIFEATIPEYDLFIQPF